MRFLIRGVAILVYLAKFLSPVVLGEQRAFWFLVDFRASSIQIFSG